MFLGCWSCQDDPLADLEDFQLKERNIMSIDFEFSEEGTPTIYRLGDSASIEVYYLDPPDFNMSATKVDAISVSLGATASVQPGTTLNFDNPDRSAKITVTSEAGTSLDWTVYLNPIPFGIEELKRSLMEDSYYTWYYISTQWKTTWDVREYYVWDELGVVAGTTGDNANK